MGKRLPYTPNSKIKAALRRLLLKSSEFEHTRRIAAEEYIKAKETGINPHHAWGAWQSTIIAMERQSIAEQFPKCEKLFPKIFPGT